jgi:hypothetical protein
MTYEDRQRLKKDESDVGKTEAQFINHVRRLIRYSSYDPITKTFYRLMEKQDGTWVKYPIGTETLERIALMSGFLGQLPLE